MEPRPFDAVESASFMGHCLLSPPNGISPSGSCFRSCSTVLPPHEACQMGSGNPPDNVRRSPLLHHLAGHDLCYSFRCGGKVIWEILIYWSAKPLNALNMPSCRISTSETITDELKDIVLPLKGS